jgi:hypothetical protein
LHNGNYRFVLWHKGKEEYENPDLLLTNGEIKFDGSGGNHYYLFSNNNCQYILFIDIMNSSNYGTFLIYKGINRRLFERIDDPYILLEERINKIDD